MADLKLCPFCGGEAKYMETMEGIFISRFVTCTKCGIETKRNYLRRNDAIKAWNTRKPMEAVVAELEKYADSRICENHKHGCPHEYDDKIFCENCGALGALEIVRNGGKE